MKNTTKWAKTSLYSSSRYRDIEFQKVVKNKK